MKLLKLAVLATLLFSFNNAWTATLTESPANIAQNGTVTATWNTIAAPTNRDWIGLYAPGAADTAYIDWIYVNTCNKSGGSTAPASGFCFFLIPGSLPNGSYELRLLATNGYTRLATSNQFNVSNAPPRFVDNGDGTISDLQTALMWEKKTGSVNEAIVCNTTTVMCPDPHNINNLYFWTATGGGTIPDGTLFTDFLTKINRAEGVSSDGQTQDRKNYSDWRIPNIAELRTIFDCTNQPICLDPIFGTTQLTTTVYWSSTSAVGIPSAWVVVFSGGSMGVTGKSAVLFARAVRGGR